MHFVVNLLNSCAVDEGFGLRCWGLQSYLSGQCRIIQGLASRLAALILRA